MAVSRYLEKYYISVYLLDVLIIAGADYFLQLVDVDRHLLFYDGWYGAVACDGWAVIG